MLTLFFYYFQCEESKLSLSASVNRIPVPTLTCLIYLLSAWSLGHNFRKKRLALGPGATCWSIHEAAGGAGAGGGVCAAPIHWPQINQGHMQESF